MADHLLSVDMGTTSDKAVLVDATGSVIARTLDALIYID